MSAPHPIRYLLVEDNPADAEMILRALRQAGFAPEGNRIETEADYLAALPEPLDIIISDHELPQFDGLRALQLRNEHRPGVPFILVSGTIGEEKAVEAMRAGAADYLLKDRLARLGPAVSRAIAEAAAHRAREKAVEALRHSEAHYRELLQSLPVAAYTTDPEGRITFYNEAAATLWGLRPELGVARWTGGERLLDADGNPLAHDVCPMAIALKQRLPIRGAEVTAIRPDGTHVPYLAYPSPLFDAQGAMRGGTNVIVDISARKASERALAAQLTRTALLNQITRAIAQRHDLASIYQVAISHVEQHLPADFGCVGLLEGKVDAFTIGCIGPRSGAIAEALNLRTGSVLPLDADALSTCTAGHSVLRAAPEGAASGIPAGYSAAGFGALLIVPLRGEKGVFAALVVARHAPATFSSAEYEFLRQLADHVALAAAQAQLHGALRIAYDELRQTQQAAMQQERLRALGQMAGGIAHDINNAICVVGIYSELLLAREPNLSAEARDSLETIHRAIIDVGHTVSRLREFYRQREPQVNLLPVSLNRLVEQIGSLTRARWSDIPQRRGTLIHFQIETAPGLPDIAGVESEIREALTNLVFNAVDAMPAGGTITIRTRLQGESTGPGKVRLALEVSDTGTGMSEDTRRRCLEPFFTTKGERGTGLGLAMVVGIAQRHHAEIEIDSEPGRGTTIRLVFDVAALAPLPARAPAAPVAIRPRRILVIDDEDAIARAVSRVLTNDGHQVTTASSGADAIDSFRIALLEKAPFEIILTDLGMPGMDGTEVARNIKEMAPGTPVIMLTGWGQGMIDEKTIPPHVDRILSKPPRVADIRASIASLL